MRLVVLTLVVIATAALGVWYLQSTIPRRILLASGVQYGSYHEDAHRYAEILGRQGVTVLERISGGAGDNVALLLDSRSGVDAAFMEGGVVPPADRAKFLMLASLRYEPLWVFYRGAETLTRLDQLRYKRIAIGTPGNGGRVIVEPLLEGSSSATLEVAPACFPLRSGLRIWTGSSGARSISSFQPVLPASRTRYASTST